MRPIFLPDRVTMERCRKIEVGGGAGKQNCIPTKKTKDREYLDIAEQAKKYLGNRGKPDEKVFTGLKYSVYTTKILQDWIKAAGITKQITFHCARHTHAIILLNNGVDIYTVSKLLGHRKLATTEIYSDILNEKKLEAVNKIPDINI